MSKLTPGPWVVSYTKFSEVHAENGAVIAVCKKLTGLVNMQANARLIASAPELLEVLQDAVDRPLITEGADWWIKVRAAIAKATGGQQ